VEQSLEEELKANKMKVGGEFFLLESVPMLIMRRTLKQIVQRSAGSSSAEAYVVNNVNKLRDREEC